MLKNILQIMKNVNFYIYMKVLLNKLMKKVHYNLNLIKFIKKVFIFLKNLYFNLEILLFKAKLDLKYLIVLNSNFLILISLKIHKTGLGYKLMLKKEKLKELLLVECIKNLYLWKLLLMMDMILLLRNSK